MLPDRGAGGTEPPRRPAPRPGAAAARDHPLRAPREAPLTGVPPPSAPAPCRSQPRTPPQSHTPRTEPGHGAACLPARRHRLPVLPCPARGPATGSEHLARSAPLYRADRAAEPLPRAGPSRPAFPGPPASAPLRPAAGGGPRRKRGRDGTAGALRCSGRASRRPPASPARPSPAPASGLQVPGCAAPRRSAISGAVPRLRGTRTGAKGSCSGLETQGSWKHTGTTGSPQDARVPGDPLLSCEKPLRKTPPWLLGLSARYRGH
ncbi:translation initiation factor IF-2-like [Parus major]|uniref:translation initiation factor IF-2-like n=1 Tax=Parus major TaxID=9157 RepID=UPI00144402DE|nr:translation initiation factor IF-2-like [Parus major]